MVVKLFHLIEVLFHLLPLFRAPSMASSGGHKMSSGKCPFVHNSLLLLFYLPLLLNKNKANYHFIFLYVKYFTQYPNFRSKCSHFTHDMKNI